LRVRNGLPGEGQQIIVSSSSIPGPPPAAFFVAKYVSGVHHAQHLAGLEAGIVDGEKFAA
jgi:hypothetical protein